MCLASRKLKVKLDKEAAGELTREGKLGTSDSSAYERIAVHVVPSRIASCRMGQTVQSSRVPDQNRQGRLVQ